MPGLEPFAGLMDRLGRYKSGRSCLYIRGLADVDPEGLERLITGPVKLMKVRYDVKT